MRRALSLFFLGALWAAIAVAASEPNRFSLSVSGAADPLTVLGPASVCPDNSLPRMDGATATKLQCSVLTVADTTGNLTGPAGGFAIIGGTGVSDKLILDGSLGTAGAITITDDGQIELKSGLRQINIADTLIIGYDWINLRYGAAIGFVPAGSISGGGQEGTAKLISDASGVISQRAGGIAQTHRIYSTADAGVATTNYERLSLSGVAGASVDIKAETAGTGADNLDINLTSAGNGGVAFRRKVKADIDGETTTLAQSGWVWTNTGDGDGEAVTLLNDPGIGAQYCFAVDVAQTITVAPSTGETLYYGTDNCVASLTSNSIGSTLCVTAITGGSGAKWFTMSHEGSWTCND